MFESLRKSFLKIHFIVKYINVIQILQIKTRFLIYVHFINHTHSNSVHLVTPFLGAIEYICFGDNALRRFLYDSLGLVLSYIL